MKRTPDQIEHTAQRALANLHLRVAKTMDLIGTPAETGKQLGLPRQTPYGWINGTWAPSAENLIKLVAASGVDAHWLLMGKRPRR